jgi:hypothetical protein
VLVDFIQWIKKDLANPSFNVPIPPPLDTLNFNGLNLSKYEEEDL